jgi:tetratricopeptide (TPR) repeat protein
VKRAAAVLTPLLLPFCSLLGAPAEWTLARSQHFEVYSQTDERDARSALLWFEQLRSFFSQAAAGSAVDFDAEGPVRVVRFASPQAYAAFRPHPNAAAFFLAGTGAEYIVMPNLGLKEPGIAAHEYGHLVVHSLGLTLPPWFAEGLAEVFSTIRVRDESASVGGDLPMRSATLRHLPWIPLEKLLSASSPMQSDSKQNDIFYAESWSLTSMLMFSPAYSSRLSEFLKAVAQGPATPDEISAVYGKRLEEIARDLRSWSSQSQQAVALPRFEVQSVGITVSRLSDFESKRLLASLLLYSGDLERAKATFGVLSQQVSGDPTVAAGLAIIAIEKGHCEKARMLWQPARDGSRTDPWLSYHYAVVGEDAGLTREEVAAALRRVVEGLPDFADARFKLGLVESSLGHYDAAIEQLRAVRSIPPGRAYAYWLGMATALTETGERDEAKRAAAKAAQYSSNAEERASALRQAYMAATDLTVQFSRDVAGNLHLVTARKPHGSSDWNPFVEPGDQIVRVQGKLGRVECSSGKITGFTVQAEVRLIEVSLPDPQHVLIQGGSPEFVCGAEDGRKVAIEYARSAGRDSGQGILRGMQFQ